MSWALVHDKDNLMRNGGAAIAGNPVPLPGTHPRALHDGALSIPYAVPGTGTWQEIKIAVTTEPEYGWLHVALLDFRYEGSMPQVEIAGDSLPVEVSAENITRGAFVVGVDCIDEITVRVRSGSRWSIGEVAVWDFGQMVFAGFEEHGPAPEVHRSHVQTQTWNVVENGPWRSKMAEPRRRWDLTFATGREERLGPLYEDAGGGLRPVIFMPVYELPGPLASFGEPVHGHLDGEFSAHQQLGGLWAEGRVLAVTESLRRLR